MGSHLAPPLDEQPVKEHILENYWEIIQTWLLFSIYLKYIWFKGKD